LLSKCGARAPDKLPELARDLLATQPDAVVAVGSFAIRAVRQASSTIPIIGSFIGEDPIAAGFATSLTRPGGNVTGIEMLAPEVDAERLDLLHQAVPEAHRVAALAVTVQRQAANRAVVEKAAALAELELLTRHAVPAILREFAAAGGLISYGSPHGCLAPGRHLRRKDPQGREAVRSPSTAADDVRAGRQSQDREGVRPHRAAIDPRPCRRGH
jgi:ABC transporter substrate binding protein